MLGIAIYVFYCARTKRRGKQFQYGPFIIIVFATLLIMADLMRHVLQDANIWKGGPWPGSSQYRANCKHEDMECLSVLGVFFTVIATWTGFILLFVGTLWNANIIQKLKLIKHKWHLLRSNK